MTDSEIHPMARKMLARFASRADSKRRDLLDELVEHNEPGVAFEMVAGMLAHGDQSLTEDDLHFLRELGRLWETSRDPIPWSLLEAKVKPLHA